MGRRWKLHNSFFGGVFPFKSKFLKFRFSIFTFYPPTHIFEKNNRIFKTIMNGPLGHLDDDYLKENYHRDTMPYSFDKWHGIFSKPSRTDTTGHNKAIIFTQSWTTRGKSKCPGARQIRTANLSVHSQIRQPPDHSDHPSWRINYSPGIIDPLLDHVYAFRRGSSNV